MAPHSSPPSDAATGDADMTPTSVQATPVASTAPSSSREEGGSGSSGSEDTSSGSSGSSESSGSSGTESDSEWDDATDDGEEDEPGHWAPLQKLADEVRGYVESAHARWTVLALVVHGGMWLSSILLTLAVSHRASGMEARLLHQHGLCFAAAARV